MEISFPLVEEDTLNLTRFFIGLACFRGRFFKGGKNKVSELIKKQKEEQVNALAEKFSKAKGIVLVDYRGMTVAEDTALRNELRKENVEYKVIKNRIMLRAFDKVGYKGRDEVLQGTTAVAISYEDPVVPAKILSDNARKVNKTKLKGGVVEGSIMDEKQIAAVASIPSKATLLGQLVGLLTSPMRSLAVAVSEVAKKNA